MAQVFKIDGSVEELPPPVGDGYTLDEVKEALGYDSSCFIQELPLPGGEVLLIDEDGKANELALNMGATTFAMAHGALFPGDYIVGNALHAKRRRGGCWT